MLVHRATLAPAVCACLLIGAPAHAGTPVPGTGHPVSAAHGAPVARGEEAAAIAAIQQGAQEQVARLAAGTAGLPDSPESRAVQLRIEAVKRDMEADILRTKAAFATRRGDLAGRRAAEDQLERLLHPRPATLPSAAPVKPVAVPGK